MLSKLLSKKLISKTPDPYLALYYFLNTYIETD